MDVKHRAIIPDMLAFPLYRDAAHWEEQVRMSPEIIAILAVGIALFSTQITTFIYLMQRIDKMNDRISAVEISRVANLRADMVVLEASRA